MEREVVCVQEANDQPLQWQLETCTKLRDRVCLSSKRQRGELAKDPRVLVPTPPTDFSCAGGWRFGTEQGHVQDVVLLLLSLVPGSQLTEPLPTAHHHSLYSLFSTNEEEERNRQTYAHRIPRAYVACCAAISCRVTARFNLQFAKRTTPAYDSTWVNLS
ncbi:hypothetical protein CBL_10411 [Carabus blaptoides fortunei]